MNRKNRVDDYFSKRNGILTVSLGDKPYKASNYAPNFYKEPGLIVGSTNKEFKISKWRRSNKYGSITEIMGAAFL